MMTRSQNDGDTRAVITAAHARLRTPVEEMIALHGTFHTAPFAEPFREALASITAANPWSLSDFSNAAWRNYRPPTASEPREARIGAIDLGLGGLGHDLLVPATVPILNRGIVIHSSPSDLHDARSLLVSLVFRTLVQSRPGEVRLALVSPQDQGRVFSPFLRLHGTQRLDGAIAFSQQHIDATLLWLTEHIAEITQMRLGNMYQTIDEYNDSPVGLPIPHYVVAIADLPANFSATALRQLLTVTTNGPRAGVHLIATLDRSKKLPDNLSLTDLTAATLNIRLKNGRLRIPHDYLASFPVIPDQQPPAEIVNACVQEMSAGAQQSIESLKFDRIVIPAGDRGQGNSTQGLVVPIGVDSRGAPQQLTLGQGAIHHALVGGDTQMGKTNLLAVVLIQLALRYPPDELELFLIDFKEVEFEQFLREKLPHARVVASVADREFGLSVLQHCRAELERRQGLFKSSEVSNFRDFRALADTTLPRVLLVMDEFQVLFPDHGHLSVAAGAILEDIARRGAAFGIHLLMSSQSPSSGQAVTFLRPMYEQMALRIALGCRLPNVSYAILGEGNDAATRLSRPGDAIYNEYSGSRGHDPIVRIADLPAPERKSWLREIRSIVGDDVGRAPVSFDPTEHALLERNPEFTRLLSQTAWPSPGSSVVAWLGEPISMAPVTTATFERDPFSSMIAIAGTDTAYRLLMSVLVSVAVQLAPEDCAFTVFDFARSSSPYRNVFNEARKVLPHEVRVLSYREAGEVLADLTEDLARRESKGAESFAEPAQFVIVAGLHHWHSMESQYGQLSVDGAGLLRILDVGPELGMHVVLWVDSVRALEQLLGRDALRYFYLRAGGHLNEGDSHVLLGSSAGMTLHGDRALLRRMDDAPGVLEKFKPYVLPEVSVLSSLAYRLEPRTSLEE